MLHDLFHQQVYKNIDFTIEADYTAVFPLYMVYDSRNGRLVGQTNANNFMGVCRIIMNEYRRRNAERQNKTVASVPVSVH